MKNWKHGNLMLLPKMEPAPIVAQLRQEEMLAMALPPTGKQQRAE